ncbi:MULTISPECIES: hypothetical protein [Sphingobium]|jgi:hypothetical protein|uniref:hypothetical protein n=1 Tax=Sphingobium TaxID=165695 RepID=UPI000DBB83B5|nr:MULTISPECIES: hypothetical protein [Sphingobium]KAA9015633.1 hypothetical protein F4U94_12010 [Sphingobium limneticum]MBU0932037.1 hypothetical protein [Alphaproteobacteria bacterium]BBD01552.1 hypothetical protein YGS_C1P2807 [Sphingobium sp. YG1]
MTMPLDKQKKLHFDLTNVGMRAQATAVGLLQLCLELRSAGILDEGAIERIKGAIACDIEVSAPRSVANAEYRRDIKARLDKLFTGEEKIGSADALAFGVGPAGDDSVCQGHA